MTAASTRCHGRDPRPDGRRRRSEIFIDCSGDGDPAARAGAPFDIGDAHGTSDVSLDDKLRLNGIDPDKQAGDAWRTIPQLMEKRLAAGTHTFPRKSAIVRPQKPASNGRVNFTQVAREDGHAINGVEPDDLTRGEIEGRKQALAASNSRAPCRGEGPPSSTLPPQLGIGETRRIKGGYQLSGEDVLGCALSFEDSIGVNGWPIEAHVPGDVVFTFPPIPESRGQRRAAVSMLVPRRSDNPAGRRPLRLDDPRGQSRGTGFRCLFRDGRGRWFQGRCRHSPETGSHATSRLKKLQETLNNKAPSTDWTEPVPEGL